MEFYALNIFRLYRRTHSMVKWFIGQKTPKHQNFYVECFVLYFDESQKTLLGLLLNAPTNMHKSKSDWRILKIQENCPINNVLPCCRNFYAAIWSHRSKSQWTVSEDRIDRSKVLSINVSHFMNVNLIKWN